MMRTIGAALIGILLFPALPAPAGAATNCDNPYVPAREGISWTYAVTRKSGGSGSQWTLSVEKVTAGGFDWRYTFPQASFTVTFTCTPAGLSAPGFGLTQIAQVSGGTFEITSHSGVGYAPPDKWTVGNSWSASSEGTFTRGGQKFTFKRTGTFQVLARERVTVPAGAFDALKLLLTVKGEVGGGGATQPLDARITQWYASGVGLVRQEDATSVHQLVSYRR